MKFIIAMALAFVLSACATEGTLPTSSPAEDSPTEENPVVKQWSCYDSPRHRGSIKAHTAVRKDGSASITRNGIKKPAYYVSDNHHHRWNFDYDYREGRTKSSFIVFPDQTGSLYNHKFPSLIGLADKPIMNLHCRRH